METPLRTNHHHQQLARFRQWLEILGYSASATANYPALIRELLSYQEQHHYKHLTNSCIETFFNHWQARPNRIRGGGLSNNYLNSMVSALMTYCRYLNRICTSDQPLQPRLGRPEDLDVQRTVLSREEVQALYDVCNTHHPMGLRDQAMLAVFYGCGLRKQEGNSLDVDDVQLSEHVVRVRDGKGHKARKVPMSRGTRMILADYLSAGRDWFLRDHQSPWHSRQYLLKRSDSGALFLNQQGNRMKEFHGRLEHLQAEAGLGRSFSLHSLRHSIATHLMASGMALESIAAFLGHGSLESTQLYTHLSHDESLY